MSRPGNIRGLYLNAWTAGSATRRRELLDVADRTEINTFVIDVKEAGEVSYPSRVALADSLGAPREHIEDVAGVVNEIAARGIRPVARIDVFRDPVLAAARPEWSIRASDGSTWLDVWHQGWADPFNGHVWNYNIAIAREALELGFAEVQLDYVRFPDVPEDVLRPSSPVRPARSEAISAFVEIARHQLGDRGPVTAAVFGIATKERATATGQAWGELIEVADALHPMVYPSHYAPGSYGFDNPNAHPYETVRKALASAVRRSPDSRPLTEKVQPWLQDFSLGSRDYGADEVRDQIRAVHDAGLTGWLLWNAHSRYTLAALR